MIFLALFFYFMLLPKIIFRYSSVYNSHWDLFLRHNTALLPNESSRHQKDILDIIKQLDEKWRIIANHILKELADIVKLSWQEKGVICYVVKNARGLSDPLTIGVNSMAVDKVILVLVHELAHRILMQPDSILKAKPSWKLIVKEYPNENKITHTHIICHAMLKNIYLKFFSKKELDDDILRCQKYQDYKKAWEIVEERGYQKILDDFSGHYAT